VALISIELTGNKLMSYLLRCSCDSVFCIFEAALIPAAVFFPRFY
jgi:hypothetical protein